MIALGPYGPYVDPESIVGVEEVPRGGGIVTHVHLRAGQTVVVWLAARDAMATLGLTFKPYGPEAL